MEETIKKMRTQWAEGDAKRDAGLTVPEDIVRHLDLVYGEHPENKLDVSFPVCLLECLAHGYVLFLKKLS